MLHRIQISTNTCEGTMQVKRAIGKTRLHKLPIYNEYMRLCWVCTLFCMICCLFSNCSKNSTKRLRSFPCVVNVSRSHVPVLLAMQWSVAWRSAFYRDREHLWIVFSLKLYWLKCCIYPSEQVVVDGCWFNSKSFPDTSLPTPPLSFVKIMYTVFWSLTGFAGDRLVHSAEEPMCTGVPGAPEESLLHVHREPAAEW